MQYWRLFMILASFLFFIACGDVESDGSEEAASFGTLESEIKYGWGHRKPHHRGHHWGHWGPPHHFPHHGNHHGHHHGHHHGNWPWPWHSSSGGEGGTGSGGEAGAPPMGGSGGSAGTDGGAGGTPPSGDTGPHHRFILVSDEADDHWDLWSIRLDGSDPVQITSGLGFPEADKLVNPRVSVDGTMIAVGVFRDANGDASPHQHIWVMNSDGSNLRYLVDQGTGMEAMVFGWSTDSHRIYFTRDFGCVIQSEHIYTIDVRDGFEQIITSTNESHPVTVRPLMALPNPMNNNLMATYDHFLVAGNWDVVGECTIEQSVSHYDLGLNTLSNTFQIYRGTSYVWADWSSDGHLLVLDAGYPGLPNHSRILINSRNLPPNAEKTRPFMDPDDRHDLEYGRPIFGPNNTIYYVRNGTMRFLEVTSPDIIPFFYRGTVPISIRFSSYVAFGSNMADPDVDDNGLADGLGVLE